MSIHFITVEVKFEKKLSSSIFGHADAIAYADAFWKFPGIFTHANAHVIALNRTY